MSTIVSIPHRMMARGTTASLLCASAPESMGSMLLSASAIWNELVQGRLAIEAHHVGETLVTLTLAPRVANPTNALTRVQASIVERLLTGCPQKVLAIEFDMAASTVSATASRALRGFGL